MELKIDVMKDQVAMFKSKCAEYGFTASAHGTIVTLTKQIPKNDGVALMDAENESAALMWMLPTTSAGSVWGTDGGSVGGYVALTTGQFRMSKSGVSKRFVNYFN